MPRSFLIQAFNSPIWVVGRYQKFSTNFLSIFNYFWKVHQWFLDSANCLKVCLNKRRQDLKTAEMARIGNALPCHSLLISRLGTYLKNNSKLCCKHLLIVKAEGLTVLPLQKQNDGRNIENWRSGSKVSFLISSFTSGCSTGQTLLTEQI